MPDPDPRETPGPPERDPRADVTDEELARAKRRLVNRLQMGGIVFLAVVVLGMLPAALAPRWPALGRAIAVGGWIAAPVLGVALLVFAVLRLRR